MTAADRSHDELYAEWCRLEEAKRAANREAFRLTEEAARLEIQLYEMEGRAGLAHCAWLRGFVAGDGSCAVIVESPEYQAELRAGAYRHETLAAQREGPWSVGAMFTLSITT